MLNKILLLILGLTTVACNNNSSSSTGAAGEESIYSGTYQLTGLECYHNMSGSVVLTGSVQGFSSTVRIDGSDFSQTISDSDCTVTSEGEIEFGTNDGTLSGVSSRATNGRCTLNGSFRLVDNNGRVTIAPLTAVMTDQDNQTVNFEFIRSDVNGNLGISEFSVNDAIGTTCYSVYDKD